MTQEKRDQLIRLLEAELDFIEGGGYGRPAGQPSQERPIFYHTPACINHWMVPGHESECHEDCILLDAVPQAHRTEAMPCHYIPLNDAGDTVNSLHLKDDQERLEDTVKRWLRETISRLKAGEDVLSEPGVQY